MKHNHDIHGRKVIMPEKGDTVLRDGYPFKVVDVRPDLDINIVASITLRGEGGEVEVGYYDYLLHKKPGSLFLDDKMYDEVFQKAIELFGKRNVTASTPKRSITINPVHLQLTLNCSGNEGKIYFSGNEKASGFRVFTAADAILYLEFKKKEIELIKSIEG